MQKYINAKKYSFYKHEIYYERSIKPYHISKKDYILLMVISETLMEPRSTSGDMRCSKLLLSRFGSGVFSAKVIEFKY